MKSNLTRSSLLYHTKWLGEKSEVPTIRSMSPRVVERGASENIMQAQNKALLGKAHHAFGTISALEKEYVLSYTPSTISIVNYFIPPQSDRSKSSHVILDGAKCYDVDT